MSIERSSFFFTMAVFLLALNLIGFHESYFLQLFRGGPGLSTAMHFHAVSGFGLFALFVFQSYSVFRGRLAVHRRIGPYAAVVAVMLLMAGAFMVVESAQGYVADPSEDQIVPMLIQASAVWVSLFVEFSFAIFMGLALMFRDNASVHKRLMFLTFVGITSPALARMGQFPVLGLSPAVFTLSSMLLLVIALAVFDLRSRGRVHFVTVLGGVVQVVGLALCAAIIPYTDFGQRVILLLSQTPRS